MNKTIICNWGAADQGKTATIRRVYEELRRLFPTNPHMVFIDHGDLKAMIEIGGLRIGIESQGDPNSRLTDEELRDFWNYDIILCACRTRGETPGVINRIANTHGFRIIWVTNHRNGWGVGNIDELVLNNLSADTIITLINEIIVGRV